jgi:hypothetical protein
LQLSKNVLSSTLVFFPNLLEGILINYF